jgi:hypothetical protein
MRRRRNMRSLVWYRRLGLLEATSLLYGTSDLIASTYHLTGTINKLRNA